jgi:hypothetical protein
VTSHFPPEAQQSLIAEAEQAFHHP